MPQSTNDNHVLVKAFFVLAYISNTVVIFLLPIELGARVAIFIVVSFVYFLIMSYLNQ